MISQFLFHICKQVPEMTKCRYKFLFEHSAHCFAETKRGKRYGLQGDNRIASTAGIQLLHPLFSGVGVWQKRAVSVLGECVSETSANAGSR